MLTNDEMKQIENFYKTANKMIDSHDGWYSKDNLFLEGTLGQQKIHLDTMSYTVDIFDMNHQSIQHLELDLHDFDWTEFGQCAWWLGLEDETPLDLFVLYPPAKSTEAEAAELKFNTAIKGNTATAFEMTVSTEILELFYWWEEDVFYKWDAEMHLTDSVTHNTEVITISYTDPELVFPIDVTVGCELAA